MSSSGAISIINVEVKIKVIFVCFLKG